MFTFSYNTPPRSEANAVNPIVRTMAAASMKLANFLNLFIVTFLSFLIFFS